MDKDKAVRKMFKLILKVNEKLIEKDECLDFEFRGEDGRISIYHREMNVDSEFGNPIICSKSCENDFTGYRSIYGDDTYEDVMEWLEELLGE